MNIEELKERLVAIDEELKEILDSIDGEVEATEELEERSKNLVDEKRGIVEKIATIEKEVERKKQEEAEVIKRGVIIEKGEEEKMNKEFRNSKEYIKAFADYIKTGNDDAVRMIATENCTETVDGKVPVPEIVEHAIQHAWEEDRIMSLVSKTEFASVLKVGFERSAEIAGVHTEGGDPIDEEELVLGICTMVPQTVKKWITITDEVLDMDNGEFLEYIYSEIAHQIVRKASALVINDVATAPTTSTATSASVSNITENGIADIVNANATISSSATNVVAVMSKGTRAYYKGLAMSANYSVDPFDGLEVITVDGLPDIVGASAGTPVAIVGSFDAIRCNFPKGFEPTFKFDDVSMAEYDLVKVVGRMPMGHGLVKCNSFCVIKKRS